MEDALELLERVTTRFPPPPNTRHSFTMNEDKKLVLTLVRPGEDKPTFWTFVLTDSDLSYHPYELMYEIEAALKASKG